MYVIEFVFVIVKQKPINLQLLEFSIFFIFFSLLGLFD